MQVVIIYIIIHEIVYLSNENIFILNICTITLNLTFTVCSNVIVFANTPYSFMVQITTAIVIARIVDFTGSRTDRSCIKDTH